MEKDKMIILALIVLILALLAGMIAMVVPDMMKQDAILNFNGNSTIKQEDSIQIRLTDENGNGIAGQTVNITVTDKDKASDFHSVETDGNGQGTFKIDKEPGKYTITISYGGNSKYNGCTATIDITIEEAVQESSSNTRSAYAYKSDGTPMYSQSEVSNYMLNKYGMVDYHVGSNGYIDMDEPGFDDAGNWVGY